MQCSDCRSGEKFKQTRVKGGSVYASLKATSSECQSNGNLIHAWVNGGCSHDSLKVASALTVKVMDVQTSNAPSEILAQRRPGEHLRAALQVPRVRLPAGDEQRGLACDAEVRHSGARPHRCVTIVGLCVVEPLHHHDLIARQNGGAGGQLRGRASLAAVSFSRHIRLASFSCICAEP